MKLGLETLAGKLLSNTFSIPALIVCLLKLLHLESIFVTAIFLIQYHFHVAFNLL